MGAQAMTFEAIANEFIQHCQVKGLSYHTLRAYRQDLNDFLTWSIRNSETQLLSKKAITAWIADMRNRGQAPTSIKRRVACVKVLCRWMEDEERLDENPFHKIRLNIRLPRRLPRNLNQYELKVLFGNRQRRVMDFRDNTLALALELLFTTGVRVGELCNIRIQDMDLIAGTIVIKGKGNRERQVFLVDDVITRQVFAYIKRRNKLFCKTDCLLVTVRGAAATPDHIRKLLHKHVEALNVERRITPHMLRHSAATQLIENGVDIRFVQKLLGHASISTTEIYTHVSDASLQDAIRTANPRGRIK